MKNTNEDNVNKESISALTEQEKEFILAYRLLSDENKKKIIDEINKTKKE